MDFYVIGDEHMVLGFGLVGIPGTIVSSGDQMLDEIKSVIEQNVRIIMVNERIADSVRDKIEAMILKMDFPLVIELPDRNGPLPDRKSMKELLKSSIGFSL